MLSCGVCYDAFTVMLIGFRHFTAGLRLISVFCNLQVTTRGQATRKLGKFELINVGFAQNQLNINAWQSPLGAVVSPPSE